jgi:hypothetical protein
MAGDLLIQPVLDLCGQIQDLDRHSVVSGSLELGLLAKPAGHPIPVSNSYIQISMTDFNICQSIIRE